MSAPALTVIKVGGSLLEHPATCDGILRAVAAMDGWRILVHGGGGQADAWAARAGIPVRRVDGRRITDDATLELVTMVYGGSVNKTLVAALQAMDCDAIGLTGADADIIRAQRRPVDAVDYGHVGDIRRVRTAMLSALLEQDLLPVIAPLTHDGAGGLLNTNGDTIAATIAEAFHALPGTQLLICLDRNGVIDAQGNTIQKLDSRAADQLIASGAVTGGMLPKLHAAFTALRSGVSRVVLCHGADIAGAAAGDGGAWTEVVLA